MGESVVAGIKLGRQSTVNSRELTVDIKNQGAHVACAPFAFEALLESRIAPQRVARTAAFAVRGSNLRDGTDTG